MSKDLDSFSWSKLGKREVSNFLGHELIYDFITHNLDPERKKAVEKFVFDSKDAQNDMMRMLNGIQYAERLSETLVSERVISQISEPSTYLAVLLKKTNFQRWPVSVKWALEALVVVSLILCVAIFVPWDKVSKLNPLPDRNETILAEIDRNQQIGDAQRLKEIEQSQPAEFADDEEVKPAKAPSVGPITNPLPKEEAKTPAPTVVKASPAPAPVTAGKVVVANQPVATATETQTTAAPETKKPGEGALYRGALAVTNLTMVGSKITEKIVALGGRKAGDVELGWKKSPDSSYFHFTLPEAKYDELMAFMATYGAPQIKKEKHPRVMPDGIIRLIITVDEAQK